MRKSSRAITCLCGCDTMPSGAINHHDSHGGGLIHVLELGSMTVVVSFDRILWSMPVLLLVIRDDDGGDGAGAVVIGYRGDDGGGSCPTR